MGGAARRVAPSVPHGAAGARLSGFAAGVDRLPLGLGLGFPLGLRVCATSPRAESPRRRKATDQQLADATPTHGGRHDEAQLVGPYLALLRQRSSEEILTFTRNPEQPTNSRNFLI